MSAPTTPRLLLLVALMAHTILVTRIAWDSSPNCDELAHLAAGLYHWQTGRFDAFRVNPPLVRMWASLPLAASRPQIAWPDGPATPCSRPEWQLAEELARSLTADRIRWALTVGRILCLPFLWLGALYCYRLAHDCFGTASGLVAAILWCFCPSVVAWGATLCPDVPAAALGITAGYYLRTWWQRGRSSDAIVAGGWLGVALLTKFTCLALLAVLPAVSLWHASATKTVRTSLQAFLISAVAWFVVNLGYGFSGWGTPVGELAFCSSSLSGVVLPATAGDNRFRQSWLGKIPVPLPVDLIRGIDQQKADFERGKRSYLAGHWQDRGWWYYYFVCAIVKLPLGFWGLAVWNVWDAVAGSIKSLRQATRTGTCRVLPELGMLLLPSATLLVLASSQTGFSRHFRYVFLCLPFVYVAVSRVAAGPGHFEPIPKRGLAPSQRHASTGLTPIARCLSPFWDRLFVRRVATWGLLAWFIGSSLACWPWSHSYFNELVGGPADGHRLLLDSNVDWGEDLYHALAWLQAHPQADPVYRVFVHDDFAPYMAARWRAAALPARPGWYLASIHRVLDPADDFHFLSRLVPCDRIAYSTWVYHVKSSDLPTCDLPARKLAPIRKRNPRSQDRNFTKMHAGDRTGTLRMRTDLARRFMRSRRAARVCCADDA